MSTDPGSSAAALVDELARTIGDTRVLEAIAATPREAFVPAAERARAWENCALPIGEGQTISQPYVVARMCELLELRGGERVLDVGTGSGYHAAVLTRLAAHVVSIERHATLSATAAETLRRLAVANVELMVGDGASGYPDGGPYDAINVAATSHQGIPPALVEQLADGGRLVMPTDGADQRLVRVRRCGPEVEIEELERVRFVPLVPGPAAP